MSTVIEREIGSTIYARILAVNMPEAERRRALVALHDAQLFVDTFTWVVKKIEQLSERLFLKPALKN